MLLPQLNLHRFNCKQDYFLIPLPFPQAFPLFHNPGWGIYITVRRYAWKIQRERWTLNVKCSKKKFKKKFLRSLKGLQNIAGLQHTLKLSFPEIIFRVTFWSEGPAQNWFAPVPPPAPAMAFDAYLMPLQKPLLSFDSTLIFLHQIIILFFFLLIQIVKASIPNL